MGRLMAAPRRASLAKEVDAVMRRNRFIRAEGVVALLKVPPRIGRSGMPDAEPWSVEILRGGEQAGDLLNT